MYGRRLACLVACLSAAGCDVEIGEATLGDLGVVEFAYSSGCLFGCTMDRSLLPGTSARISVSDPGDVPGLAAFTTAPRVATAVIEQSCSCERGGDDWAEGSSVDPSVPCEAGFTKRCDNTIVVTAHTAGDCKLELRSPSGDALLDRTSLFVREPHHAWFEHYGTGSEPTAVADIHLTVGQNEGVRARLEDVEGRPMLVTGNVEWTISNASIAGFPQWIGAPLDTIVGDDLVSVEALAAGGAELTMRAGAFEHTATLLVSQ